MNKIPCKWLEHWTENQSPLGSGENWPMHMTDCGHPPIEDVIKELALEEYENCDNGCPGYEAMELAMCEKHGEFIKAHGCESCMVDDWQEAERLAKEYYG